MFLPDSQIAIKIRGSTPATGIAQAFYVFVEVASLVSLRILLDSKAPLFVAGLLRGSAGTLWDFMCIMMAVSAH